MGVADKAIRYTKLEIVIEVFRLAVVTVVACRFFGLGVNSDSLDALSLFCIAVNSNQNCVYFHIARRYFKRKRHLCSKRL